MVRSELMGRPDPADESNDLYNIFHLPESGPMTKQQRSVVADMLFNDAGSPSDFVMLAEKCNAFCALVGSRPVRSDRLPEEWDERRKSQVAAHR